MRLLKAIVPMILMAAVSITAAQEKAPNFKAKTSTGATMEMAKLKGKAVVVNFWATWCGPCRQEIPGFIEVYGKYRQKGLEIVGVALDDNGWEAVKPFMEKQKIPYPVVLPDKVLQSGFGEIQSIPATFFINRKGVIVGHHVGYMDKAEFEAKVKGLL